MNFTVIDFETANRKRTSACSLGIAVVENLQIVKTKYWLIRPEPFEFDYFNVLVHGLTEKILRNKPLFSDCWPKIKPYLDNKTIVAHNASFDISVLRRTLEFYGLAFPNLNYICSYRASQKVFSHVINYRLDTIAHSLGIYFNHHNALEDAKASAEILKYMLKTLKASSVNEFAEKINLRLGKLSHNNYIPCTYIKNRFATQSRTRLLPLPKRILPTTTSFDENNDFYGKRVAFTGALNGMGRSMAYQAVADLGGIPVDGVTLKTNYLVLGFQDYSLLNGHKQSAKTRKAIEYAKRGTGIQIISEEDFYKMIGDDNCG